MISEDLKQKIIPNLKLALLEEDWDKIDIMFSECYKTVLNGTPVVTLYPHDPNTLAMQFSMLTGSYIDVTEWSYIKTVGERL